MVSIVPGLVLAVCFIPLSSSERDERKAKAEEIADASLKYLWQTQVIAGIAVIGSMGIAGTVGYYGSRHCWVTCGDDSYSLNTVGGSSGIGGTATPSPGPLPGGVVVDSGNGQCKCLAANYAANITPRPYNPFNSNSNWWANQLLQCCGINLDMPQDASGWNTGDAKKFKCCQGPFGPDPPVQVGPMPPLGSGYYGRR